jgi:hypothetical protein
LETKHIPQNTLDSTLRYLYYTVRLRRCELMAIEFKHRAKTYRADTPEEAANLVKLLREMDRSEGIYDDDGYSKDGDPVYKKVWDLDTFMELMRSLGDLQKDFLKSLFSKYQVPSAAVRKELGMDSEVALAGVLSGLSKQLKAMNLTSADLYSVAVKWDGKKKRRLFTLNQDFSTAALEAGWPDEWKGESHASSTKGKRK